MDGRVDGMDGWMGWWVVWGTAGPPCCQVRETIARAPVAATDCLFKPLTSPQVALSPPWSSMTSSGGREREEEEEKRGEKRDSPPQQKSPSAHGNRLQMSLRISREEAAGLAPPWVTRGGPGLSRHGWRGGRGLSYHGWHGGDTELSPPWMTRGGGDRSVTPREA